MKVLFVDANRESYRVEPICRMLPIAPSTYYEQKAREKDPSRQPARAKRDVQLCGEIRRVRQENFDVVVSKNTNELKTLCLLFIHPPAHGSEVGPAARNTLDSARIPRASKLLICGLFQKGRVLAQDAIRRRAQ